VSSSADKSVPFAAGSSRASAATSTGLQSGVDAVTHPISKCIISVLQNAVDVCDYERYFSDSDEIEAEDAPFDSVPSSYLPVSTRRQFNSFQVLVFTFFFSFDALSLFCDFVSQYISKPIHRIIEPFQMRCDSTYGFPDPTCLSVHRPDFLWLDACKLQYVLDEEVRTHRELFCKIMIEELRDLSRLSSLPYLSKSDMIKELKAPIFGLLPLFQEELEVLSSNLDKITDSVALPAPSNFMQNRVRSEGGNYFSSLGDETGVSLALKNSWKRKLQAIVHYDVVDNEREQAFHDRMINALELLHGQSRLERLRGDDWFKYWSSYSFGQCLDTNLRGIIKNMALEVVSLNPAFDGRKFGLIAYEAVAAAR
jgi:hypothetical protein